MGGGKSHPLGKGKVEWGGGESHSLEREKVVWVTVQVGSHSLGREKIVGGHIS